MRFFRRGGQPQQPEPEADEPVAEPQEADESDTSVETGDADDLIGDEWQRATPEDTLTYTPSAL
ncbi:MAG TPA: hypothetical protein VIH37_08740, partial [Candidatus Limnocylindrales bacterium]